MCLVEINMQKVFGESRPGTELEAILLMAEMNYINWPVQKHQKHMWKQTQIHLCLQIASTYISHVRYRFVHEMSFQCIFIPNRNSEHISFYSLVKHVRK